MVYANGLVVGKFMPLHKGHELLLNTAQYMCVNLVIITYGSIGEIRFTPKSREVLLRNKYPSALVIAPHINYPDDDADEDIHRLYCFSLLKKEQILPDVIFTSEKYGEGFASRISELSNKKVIHWSVDEQRVNVKISGTVLRNDKSKWLEFVSKDVIDEYTK